MDLLSALLSAANRGWAVSFQLKGDDLRIEAVKTVDGANWVADAHVRVRDLRIASNPGQFVGGKVVEITDDTRLTR